jgi:outer membrane cobalamin receptor
MSTHHVGIAAAATPILCLSTGCAHANAMRVDSLVGKWIVSCLLLALGCAPPRSSSPGSPDPQVITEEQVEASQAATAYEVIQKLRANFLSYRGETSLNRNNSQPFPTVYVDGMEFGQLASLRTIPASQISTIRLYRSWEATTKFGSGNMGGVIAITTRR